MIQPKPEWSANAWIKSQAEYEAMYKRSIDDPEGFWAERAAELDWTKKWDKVVEWQFEPTPSIKYFLGGELNASYNCVDRWVEAGKGDKPAIIFEGDPRRQQASTPTPSSRTRSAGSPTCSRSTASRRATASPSTCR